MINILYYIFFIDIVLLKTFYVIGWLAVSLESKYIFKGEVTIEMEKSEKLTKEWTELHPILDFFQSFYYEIGRKLEIPGDTYRNTKWFIQRGKRGYSDRDIWGFHYYLSELIHNGMKELKKQVHGVPGGLAEKFKDKNDPDSIDIAMKEWERILDEIAWTFESAHKVNENDWVLIDDERYRSNSEKFYEKLNKEHPEYSTHVMSKEECVRYRKGWYYFQKYFFSLWD